MTSAISTASKRAFLDWLIGEHAFKNRESMYLLKYISRKESLLHLLRFVDDITLCPRAMMFSTVEQDNQPFLYRKSHIYTTEPDKAFHDIRMDKDEAIYVQVNFPHRHKKVVYAAVVEENPFFQPDLSMEFGFEAERFLKKVTLKYQEEKLIRQIDRVLDNGDQQLFFKLTNQLKKLREDNS